MAQPEYIISKNIIKYLTEQGAWCFKVHGGPTQRAGIPDILGCYKGRLFGFEVKQPGKENTVSPRQSYEMTRIRESGGYARMVTSVVQVKEIFATW
jgi:penicillin-binding protein-related factor A (putative recombinase)